MLQRVYATAIATVRPYVRPSVTRLICIKTAERIIEILSPSHRPIILVFRHQGVSEQVRLLSQMYLVELLTHALVVIKRF